MKKILIPILLLMSSLAFAGPGDTITVSSLDNAQMTWWGNDDEWGVFPDTSVEYRRILMDVTLGCATGGCSDWDYTVKIEGFHQTGEIDSSLVPYYNYTVDGVMVPDTFYYSNDTTYVTSWNVLSSNIDSNAVDLKKVYIYGDTNNYLVPTDSLFVWEANFTNDIYDGSGNVTGNASVAYDSFLVTSSILRYKTFEIINGYELGRFMTPYGGYMANGSGGFNNSWTHQFTYDVTDFSPIFHDSVQIRAFYGGWSSGFSATVNFRLIEGTPARDVLKIENLYRSGGGGWNSDDPVVFENTRTPALSIPILSNTSTAKAKITPSGHGFVNSQNCAEFCNREYRLKTDGIIRYTQDMWRDDCGLNPVYPQGGTWLTNRANWCPGNKTHAYDHELGQYIVPGTNLDIDLDLEIYAMTVPSGEVPPNYIIDAQLIQFGDANFNVDAEMLDIISPSLHDEYSRKNPICGKPVIEIRNGGGSVLTFLTINYGVKGAAQQTMAWSGNLDFMETAIVELDPLEDWNGVGDEFTVTLSNPNNTSDEYTLNDAMTSKFESVPVYSNNLLIDVYTNNRPNENEWVIKDAEGTVLFSNDLDTKETQYTDEISLDKGCYEFLLTDSDGDGLSYWANGSENNGGPVKIKDKVSGSALSNFKSDFGTEIRQQFYVSGSLSLFEKHLNKINIYPNPSKGFFNIQNKGEYKGVLNIEITNIMGVTIYSIQKESLNDIELNLSDLIGGTYFINLKGVNVNHTEKISIVK